MSAYPVAQVDSRDRPKNQTGGTDPTSAYDCSDNGAHSDVYEASGWKICGTCGVKLEPVSVTVEELQARARVALTKAQQAAQAAAVQAQRAQAAADAAAAATIPVGSPSA